MVFSPIEMVTIYNQANNKKKQIKIFMETENKSYDEICQILKDNGVDYRKLPRAERSDKGKQKAARKFDPTWRDPQGERPTEDAIIDRLDRELEAKREEEVLPDPIAVQNPDYIPDPPVTDPLHITLMYVRDLFARKKALEAQLAEVNDIINQIVEASS